VNTAGEKSVLVQIGAINKATQEGYTALKSYAVSCFLYLLYMYLLY